MIYLYTRYRTGCVSTVKAERWFKTHNIEYQVLSPRSITEEHVKQILCLSDCTEDIIISRRAGYKTWESLKLTEQHIEDMGLNSFIRLLVKSPFLLKTLIIFDDKKVITGYHEENIRMFLPAEYRQIVRKK